MSWIPSTSPSSSSYVPVSITNPLPAPNITFNGVNPLDPSHQTTEFTVRCIYPISGQFGLTARLLYYALLAFSLIARSHQWLSASALASSMAYSSSASIYALILAGTYKYTALDDQFLEDPYQTGDIDMIALWCILSAGFFAVVPFLSWSSTLRRLKTRRHIFTYWTFLIAIGGTCAGIKLRGGHPFKIYWATAAAICSSTSDRHDNPAEPYLSSWYAWSSNNCTSQCGNLDPGLVLRTGTQMVPIIQTEFSNVRLPVIAAREILGSLSAYACPIVFIQWFYACSSGNRTPSDARDRICTKLFREGSSYRFMLAVSLASSVYFFACASLTICPFLLVFNIVFNEMNMLYLPQDEPLTAVGQWLQCVIAILLVMAAIINKYHDSWSRKAKKSWKITMEMLFVHRKERPSDLNDLGLRENPKAPPLEPPVETMAQPNHLIFGKPLQQEWCDFYSWIKNPIEISRLNIERRDEAARAELPGRSQVQSLDQTERFLPLSSASTRIEWANLHLQKSQSL